jgi:hypothetical protein
MAKTAPVYRVAKLHSYSVLAGITAKKFEVGETVLPVPTYSVRLLLLKIENPFLFVFAANNCVAEVPTVTVVVVAVVLGVESMFAGIEACRYKAMCHHLKSIIC